MRWMRMAATVLALAACSSAADERKLADATREIDALRARSEALERQVVDLRAAAEKTSAKAAGSVVVAPAAATAGASPYATAKPWVADAVQVRDAVARDAALDAIRRALASDDPALAAAGLVALPQIAQVAYDKSAVRALVLRHAKSQDAAVRTAFPFAILNAGGPKDGDIDLVEPLTSDPVPNVRDAAGRSLVFFANYDLTGPAGERVLALLDDPDRQVRRDVLASIWGSRVSPGIEAKLLAMFAGDDRQARHDAFYFGLSTLKDKSSAVVDACIAAMESSDSELQWRARWGLAHGVPDAERGKVGDAYLRLLAARSDTQLEQDAFTWLAHHGSVAQAAELEKLAQSPLLAEETRKAALVAAAAIRHAR